jgi:hypothetical protein
LEHVIVEFPERREVFMGGVSQGDNLKDSGGYWILPVDEGFHTFTLGGPKDFDPDSQGIDVRGTTPGQPLHVVFTKKV